MNLQLQQHLEHQHTLLPALPDIMPRQPPLGRQLRLALLPKTTQTPIHQLRAVIHRLPACIHLRLERIHLHLAAFLLRRILPRLVTILPRLETILQRLGITPPPQERILLPQGLTLRRLILLGELSQLDMLITPAHREHPELQVLLPYQVPPVECLRHLYPTTVQQMKRSQRCCLTF